MGTTIYNKEDFEEFVNGILFLLDATYPTNPITFDDVASCVATVGLQITEELLEDLNITIDLDNQKVYVRGFEEFRNYAKRKVKFFWETLREANNAKSRSSV